MSKSKKIFFFAKGCPDCILLVVQVSSYSYQKTLTFVYIRAKCQRLIFHGPGPVGSPHHPTSRPSLALWAPTRFACKASPGFIPWRPPAPGAEFWHNSSFHYLSQMEMWEERAEPKRIYLMFFSGKNFVSVVWFG